MPPLVFPKTASKVPKFNDLRSMVNYGEERKPLGPSFWKHLQAFRELHVSPSGVHGSEFLKWRDQAHRDGLIHMADAYLDAEGNGEKFWPADRKAPEFNTLQYSRPVDHEFIKSIVVQILFRLNRQQQSNDKYKRKKTAHDDDPNRWLVARKSLFTKASSSAAHHAALSDPQSLCNKEFTTASFSLDTVASDLINPDLPARGTGQTEADPYMVPESPTSVARDDPFFPQAPVGEGVSLTSHRPDSEHIRSTEEQETGAVEAQQKPSGKKRRRRDDSPVYRNPPRLRKQPLRQSLMASSEAIEEACLSPRTSIESTHSHENIDKTLIQEHNDQPDPDDRTIVPDGSVSQVQLHSSSQPNMNDTAQSCPEMSTRTDTRPSNAVETGSNASRKWPPAPTVHDEPESSPLRASDASMEKQTHVEVGGYRAPDSTRFPSETNSLFPDIFTESHSHCDTHPFEKDQDSISLEHPQSTSLPIHPGPTHPSAPVAVMVDTSIETNCGISNIPDQAFTGVDNQCSPHQSTQPPEPIAQPTVEAASDTQETSSLLTGQSVPGNPPLYSPSPELVGKPCKEPEVNVTEHRERSVTARNDTKQALSPSEPFGKSAVATTANVKFSFVLVLSRSPRWQATEWVPNGKFLKKRLPELKRELPVGFGDRAPGLMFRLISSDLRIEEPIPHGEDGTFDIMRKYFAAQIGRAVREQVTGEPMSFRIEIEGLRDDYLQADDETKESDDENLC